MPKTTYHSKIMLASILLFRNYSFKNVYLLFSKLCRHNRRRPRYVPCKGHRLVRTHKQVHTYTHNTCIIITYRITKCKQQKLSKRKVLWFTRFHPNVRRENFCSFAPSVWRVLKKAMHC